jgi:NADH-quinone oxidoreductase subunit K
MAPLHQYLLLAALLFGVGLAGVLTRRNGLITLMGIELMLNAANLNFIAFWRHSPNPEAMEGVLLTMFAIGVAAAEVAVGLALVIAIYRRYRSVNLDEVDQLKG